MITCDSIRATYKANADTLRAMLDKAERTGRKVGGYSAEQLRPLVDTYALLSVSSDDSLRQHFAQSQARIRERLHELRRNEHAS